MQLGAQIFIQAEDYSNMQGVETQGTSDDGGGVNVGWIDNSDWMEYEIYIPIAGEYVLNARIASVSGGGAVNISTGTNLLGNLSIGATGGWQVWESVESSALTFTQGSKTLRLKAVSGGFNLNWFELRLTNPVDTDNPSSPVIMDATADVHTISVNWSASDDATSTVSGYKIFEDGMFSGFSNDTSFSLSKLSPETEVSLSVHACDLAGNLSSPVQVTMTTLAMDWDLVWADEFEGAEVDLSKWSYETGGGGWGNGEAQYYTSGANSSVADGLLTIEARQETIGGNDYTSSRMNNALKGDFLYGRIEVRAKLPSTGGTWPAIWTLPTDWVYGGWPECGEIDIMEHTGNNLGYVFGSIHTGAYNHLDGTNKSGGVMVPDVVNTFHTYALEWYPDHLDWYYDDQIVFTFENEYNTYAEWPFDVEHHLMLNIAIGGGLGGEIDHNGVWPQQMFIDYVRIYDIDFGAGDTIPPTAPSNLQAEVSGISVELSWNPSTDNKYIEKYYVFKNDELIDSVLGTNCMVPNLEALTEYTFGVQAKDYGGNYSENANVSITTTDIVSIPVPGKFEAENYLYMEGIQTENCTDMGGGINVGYIDVGDWLEYSIDVASAGKYFLAARTAAQSLTGSFQLLDENQNVLTTMETPVTGGWQNWKTSVSEGFDLNAGVQRITIMSLAKDFNFNWFGLSTDSTEYGTSVNSVFDENYNLYPNPITGNALTIALNERATAIEVDIYTLQGQKVVSRRFRNVADRIRLDNLDLEAGLYLVSIKQDNAIHTAKLLAK